MIKQAKQAAAAKKNAAKKAADAKKKDIREALKKAAADADKPRPSRRRKA